MNDFVMTSSISGVFTVNRDRNEVCSCVSTSSKKNKMLSVTGPAGFCTYENSNAVLLFFVLLTFCGVCQRLQAVLVLLSSAKFLHVQFITSIASLIG